MKKEKANRADQNLIKIIMIILPVLICFSCRTVKKEASSAPANAPGEKVTTVTVNNMQEGDKEIPFVVVEEMPLFPGGDTALISFIAKNTRYPESAKARKAEGRVILRFCVGSDGSVSQPSVLRSADPELDAEAIRVTESLPKFIPGKQGGKAVPVWYMIPVEFKLQ